MTFRVTFLGTSGAVPTPDRNPIGIFVNREGDGILFDVGEGIQRQIMKFGTGLSFDYICITHLHGDHYYGIPGLLETLEFTEREAPLSIFVPRGTTDRMRALIRVTIGETTFPINVAPVEPGDVVIRSAGYELRAFATDHDARSVGYVLEEDERPGRFNREQAIELGVPEGPMFGRLQRGSPVELDDGSVVDPDAVLGPPRPGRKLVYTGDTRPSEATVDEASRADLLIHEATFGDDRVDRAEETAHSTARQAGVVANRADVDRLALVHISSRYAGQRDRLLREAQEAFDGECLLPDDGDELSISLRDHIPR